MNARAGMIASQRVNYRLDFIDFGMNLKANLPLAAGNLLGQSEMLLTRGMAIYRPAAKATLRRIFQEPINQNLFEVDGRNQGQQGFCVNRRHPLLHQAEAFRTNP